MLLLLNSCYFNSAGYLYAKAGYTASNNMADAKIGGFVFTDGSSYYVTLPRYREGEPLKLHYSITDKKDENEEPQRTGDMDMYRIPADFAAYLTGNASAPTTPSYMERVEDGSVAVKSVLRIVNPGTEAKNTFTYASPNATMWKTLGAIDWVCVDIPVSVVESCVAPVAMCAVLLAAAYARAMGR